jgi:hypothetical protein
MKTSFAVLFWISTEHCIGVEFCLSSKRLRFGRPACGFYKIACMIIYLPDPSLDEGLKRNGYPRVEKMYRA